MKSIRLIAIGRESSSKSSLVSFLRACGGLTFLLLALLLFLALPVLATAASDGAPDPTFNNFKGVQKIPYVYGQADYVDYKRHCHGRFFDLRLLQPSDRQHRELAPNLQYQRHRQAQHLAGTVDTSFNIPIRGEVRTVWLTEQYRAPPGRSSSGANSASPTPERQRPYYNLARLTWTGATFEIRGGYHLPAFLYWRPGQRPGRGGKHHRAAVPPATSWWGGITCSSKRTPPTPTTCSAL